MESAGAEAHLRHRALHQLPAGVVQHTHLPHFTGPHIRVAEEEGVRKPAGLPFPCRIHPFANLAGGLASLLGGQLFKGHIQMNIDAPISEMDVMQVQENAHAEFLVLA